MTDDVGRALQHSAEDVPHPGPRLSRWMAQSSQFVAPPPRVPVQVRASAAALAACLVAAGSLVVGLHLQSSPAPEATRHGVPSVAPAPVAVVPAGTDCADGQQTYSSARSGFGVCYPGGWVLTDLSSPNLPTGAGTLLALGLPGVQSTDRIKPLVIINSTLGSIAAVERDYLTVGSTPGAFFGTVDNASETQPRLQPRQMVLHGLAAEEILVRDADTGARSRVVLVARGDRVVRIEQVSAAVTEEEFSLIVDSFTLAGGYTANPQFKVDRELTDPEMRNRA